MFVATGALFNELALMERLGAGIMMEGTPILPSLEGGPWILPEAEGVPKMPEGVARPLPIWNGVDAPERVPDEGMLFRLMLLGIDGGPPEPIEAFSGGIGGGREELSELLAVDMTDVGDKADVGVATPDKGTSGGAAAASPLVPIPGGVPVPDDAPMAAGPVPGAWNELDPVNAEGDALFVAVIDAGDPDVEVEDPPIAEEDDEGGTDPRLTVASIAAEEESAAAEPDCR
jgi:hypothetical protein